MAKVSLTRFNPSNFPRLHPMKMGDAQGAVGAAGTAINALDWTQITKVFAPMIWAWYDQHKDQKVTKIFGFFTITVSSFGIAESVLTAIFGARPTA